MSSTETMHTGGVATGAEHRRHQRLRLETKVKYKVINRQAVESAGAPGLKPDGKAKNISLSGLAITTENKLTKGDYLKVELSLPGMGRPTRALAEVMWARIEDGENLAGIRFLILLNEADDASIRRFMDGQQGRQA